MIKSVDINTPCIIRAKDGSFTRCLKLKEVYNAIKELYPLPIELKRGKGEFQRVQY